MVYSLHSYTLHTQATAKDIKKISLMKEKNDKTKRAKITVTITVI